MDGIMGPLLKLNSPGKKIGKSFLLIYMLRNPILWNWLLQWCITSGFWIGLSLHARNNSFVAALTINGR